ncbi:MAG: ABC transporter substrate-binding protein [Bacillota bacterium]
MGQMKGQWRKEFSVVLVAALILGLLSAMGQAAAKPAFGGTLRIGTLSDPDTLNVLQSNSVSASWILDLMYPTLLIMNEQGEKVPYLAKDWGYSEDGLTAWFELRNDVKWQDGTPITSKDVKFTCDVTKQHKIGFNAALLADVKEIRTPTPTRVEFKLSKTYGPFLTSIGFWLRVVPEHIWKGIEDPKRFPNSNPVGAGPFKLAKYEIGQYYEMEAVDSWFDAPAGKPYLDKVLFKVYPDINTMILALQRGEIDLCANPIPPASADRLKATPGIKTAQTASLGYVYFTFNQHRDKAKALQDVRLRKAIAHAVNKEMIRAIVLRGQAKDIAVAVSPVLGSWHNPNVTSYPYDPEKAKTILQEAGYKDTNGDGVRETPTGEKLAFELLYDGGNANIAKAMKMVADDLQKVGIVVTHNALERNGYLAAFRKLDYDIAAGGWGIMDEPADYLYLLYHSSTYGPDGINRSGINDPQLDRLIDQARGALDAKKAREYVWKIQERLKELVPEVHLWVETYILAYRDDFAGYGVFPSDLRGMVDPQSLVRVYKIK